MPLSIIGAGLPRTGTSSLQLALEQMDLGPCYHMRTVIEQPEVRPAWERAASGALEDWEEIFAGYNATVDGPGCYYYRPLAERYPDAKVILTVRDEESWVRSMMTTIFRADRPGGSPEERLKHPVGKFMQAVTPFDMRRIQDRDFLLDIYHRHNAEVRETIAPGRLLEYDVSQGWGPLCDFLGYEMAEAEFPHENSQTDFAQRFVIKPV